MNLDILPFRLIVLSFKKSDIHTVLHSLLSTAFFSGSEFFSYTEAPDLITLIIESRLLHLFKACNVSICSTVWRCVECSAGIGGSDDLSKALHLISKSFASSNISIFQVSTLWNDLTLFPENKLKEAIECLQDGNFDIVNCSIDNVSDPDEVPSPSKENLESESIIENSSKIRHIVKEPLNDENLVIAGIQKDYSNCVLAIIERMIKPEKKGFTSLTMMDQNYTLVLDKKALSIFPPNALMYLDTSISKDYSLIEIGNAEASNGLGFEESGIVATYTESLSRAGITCFYISTYLSDFVIVPSKDKILHRQAFEEAEKKILLK